MVEPAQPKVKLRLSAKSPDPTPKITLRFGQKTGIEGNTGVAVDSQALKRQQDLVKAGVNGQSSGLNNGGSSHTGLRNPFGGSSSVAGSTVVPTLNQLAQERHGSAASSPPATNGIKHETQSEKSPALATVQPRNGSNTSDEVIPSPDLAALTMPPPASITPRLPSNSPHPQMMTMSTHPPPIQNLSNPLDSRWRLPGKGNKPRSPSMCMTNTIRCIRCTHFQPPYCNPSRPEDGAAFSPRHSTILNSVTTIDHD